LTVKAKEPFADYTTCEADRQQLANTDNYQYMLDLIGDANRANATFYTIDPAVTGIRHVDARAAPPRGRRRC
jgi:hypothetical protein